MIFVDKLSVAITGAGGSFWGRYIRPSGLACYLLLLVLLFDSAIFSWVANKFDDAHTTYMSLVLKIMWYEQAYNQIIGLVYFYWLPITIIAIFATTRLSS